MNTHDLTLSGRDLAERLIDFGIPVIVVGPDDRPRVHSWQTITAEQAREKLNLHQDGDAWAMVCGHGIDAVDVDPKNGGSKDSLGLDFPYFGVTTTPSGGAHYIVPSTSVGRISPLNGMLGHVGDYCGGCADGTSRGLLFLPGSKRTKYPDGGYVMSEPWDIEGCLAAEPDATLTSELLDCQGGSGSDKHDKMDVYIDDSPERDVSLGVHPYALSAVNGELAKLDALAAEPWFEGAHWDVATFSVACNLIEFANSNWSGYSIEQAENDLMIHAPVDKVWTASNVEEKWRSALTTVGDGGRRAPVNGDSKDGVTTNYERYSLSDADLSAQLVDRFVGDRLLAWGNTRWAIWDGKRWDLFAVHDEALGIVEHALQQIMFEGEARAEELRQKALSTASDDGTIRKIEREHEARLKSLHALRSYSKIKSVTTLMRNKFSRRMEEFDGPNTAELLNCANGVVNLRTKELTPHAPGLMFTKVTPVNYVPGAVSKDWSTALTALPSDVVDWVQLKLGQAAIGAPPTDDVIPFFKGDGENGKSALLDTVSQALGEFAGPVSKKVLTASPSDHPTEMFDLKGLRFAFIEELPQGDYVNMNQVKTLAGTKWMTARPMRQDNVRWMATHTLVVTTNHDTQISDSEHATWRRLARVNFPHKFDGSDPEHLPDGKLKTRLSSGSGSEACLAWLVDGAQRVLVDGLTRSMEPERIKNDTSAWRFESNAPARFLAEMYHPAPGLAVQSAHVFDLYRQWCKRNGNRPMSSQTFWSRVREHDWFVDGQMRKHVVKVDKRRFPEGMQPKGSTANALDGAEISDSGEELLNALFV